MNWNYHDGDWQSATVKVRDDGQWVQVGGGETGEGEFGWVDPPERSTTEYTSDYSSIQDGLDSIGPDTELVVDDGPYTESFDFPSTDEITLSGGADGATIENPGVGAAMIDADDWSLERTSCDAISEGDTTLSVGDASIFSPGDDVRIHDPDEMYKGMTGDDLRNTYNQRKGEFRVVESIDASTDTITLESGTHQHYDDPTGELEVAAIDWAITSLRVHNLTLDGGVSSPDDDADDDLRGMSIEQCKNVWVTDVTSQNWNKDGWTCDQTLNYYVDGGHVENVDRYGVGISGGTTHARVQNVTGDGAGRYQIQSGGGGTGWDDVSRPTYDTIVRNCHSANNDFFGDAHFATENLEYRNCSSSDASTMKIRGYDQHVVGGEFDTGGSSAIQSTQIARNCSVEELTVTGGNRAWIMWPKEGHEFQNLLIKDCQFENMSGTVFWFRSDEDDGGNPPDISNLQVVNSSFNGEWITDSHVQNSDGDFSEDTIDYATEYPDDQTPAEYFG